MYSRYVNILKILQWIGYLFIFIFAISASSAVGTYGGGGAAFGTFLFVFLGLSAFNYLATQGLIAIVDLLNSIESNTRKAVRLLDHDRP